MRLTTLPHALGAQVARYLLPVVFLPDFEREVASGPVLRDELRELQQLRVALLGRMARGKALLQEPEHALHCTRLLRVRDEDRALLGSHLGGAAELNPVDDALDGAAAPEVHNCWEEPWRIDLFEHIEDLEDGVHLWRGTEADDVA